MRRRLTAVATTALLCLAAAPGAADARPGDAGRSGPASHAGRQSGPTSSAGQSGPASHGGASPARAGASDRDRASGPPGRATGGGRGGDDGAISTASTGSTDGASSSSRPGPPAHAERGGSSGGPDRGRPARSPDRGPAVPSDDPSEDLEDDDVPLAEEGADGGADETEAEVTDPPGPAAGSGTPLGPLLAVGATPPPVRSAGTPTEAAAPPSPGAGSAATPPSAFGPATILVPLDGDVSRALDALTQRTRATLGGVADDLVPPRDLGVPAALLALLGAYLAGLRWLDRGGLPMARLEDGREDDVQLVL